MKLATVSARMLCRAIDIYMQCAYPRIEPPSNIRAKAGFDETEPLESILASENFEKDRSREDGVMMMRYMLRLGNARYPHMKLGLVNCAGDEDDFVFVVDTHDRHFRIDPNVPGSSEFRELQVYNDKTKQNIERRWEDDNLPTLQQVLQSYDTSICSVAAAQKTVLIVEDEAHIADLERDILECGGYNVIVCLSGKDAIKVAEKNPIDLCLLDIMMPDADGFDVVRILKERHLKHFPVIFVTAMPETRVDPKIADGFLAKPFGPQFFLEKVRSYIG